MTRALDEGKARTRSGGAPTERPSAFKSVHFAAPTALVDRFWAVVNSRGGSAIKTLEAALAALGDAQSANRDEERRMAAKARFDAAVARRMDTDEQDAREQAQREARTRAREKRLARRAAEPEPEDPPGTRYITSIEEYREVKARQREERRLAKEAKAAAAAARKDN